MFSISIASILLLIPQQRAIPTRSSRAESIMSVNDIAVQSQPLLNTKESNKVIVFGDCICVKLVVLLTRVYLLCVMWF